MTPNPIYSDIEAKFHDYKNTQEMPMVLRKLRQEEEN